MSISQVLSFRVYSIVTRIAKPEGGAAGGWISTPTLLAAFSNRHQADKFMNETIGSGSYGPGVAVVVINGELDSIATTPERK